MIVDVRMDRGELLKRLHSSEPEHRTLASSEREVTVLDHIIGVRADFLFLGGAKVAKRCLIRFQAVGNYSNG
jgi:hypothetical protein